MQHLYYLRHGESKTNRSLKWGGHADAELTKRGIAQATTAGKTASAKSMHFDLIVSSPLRRTNDTARLFAKEIGYPDSKIEYDKNIVERFFGSLDGKRDLKIALRYLKDESSIDKYPGVESLQMLQARADNFLNKLGKRAEKNILIVGHGAFGRALVRSIHKRPLSQRGKTLKNARLIKLV